MSDIFLTVQEEETLNLQYVEARIKPEQTKSVVPSYEQQIVLPDAGMTLGQVNVDSIPDPTETLHITQNGEFHVERIGLVDVDVPQGVFPVGTIELTENNTTADVTNYANAHVSVNTDPVKGFVIDEWDDNGYPITLRFVGFEGVPESYLRKGIYNDTAMWNKIEKVVFSEGIKIVGTYVIYNLNALKEVVYSNTCSQIYGNNNAPALKKLSFGTNRFTLFGGGNTNAPVDTIIFRNNIEEIPMNFGNNTTLMLIDMSHNTQIPVLPSTATLLHASGCVLRIPANFDGQWQNETNWNLLDDVIWEIV